MDRISMLDCGIFGNNSMESPHLSNLFDFQMACQEYLRWGDREVYPILAVVNLGNGSKIIINPEKQLQHSSNWVTVLKIISYITIILPIIALIVNHNSNLYYNVGALRFSMSDKRECVGLIKATPTSFHTYDRELANQNRHAVDPILGDLYLGDGDSFIDCTGITGIPINDESGARVGVRVTNNPLGFRDIVTLCPLVNVAGRSGLEGFMAGQAAATEQRIHNNFFGRVNWHYVGRTVSDMSAGHMGERGETEESRALKWATFIHDTTYPEDSLSTFDPVGTRDQEGLEANIRAKAARMNLANPSPTEVEEWFESSFRILDRAVFGLDRSASGQDRNLADRNKVLVHCAEGKSRSAALIVAYLIKRFDVTVDDAVAFVRSRRPLVDTKFEPELRAYYNLLHGADARGRPAPASIRREALVVARAV